MRMGLLLLVACFMGCASVRAPMTEWGAAEDDSPPDDACVLSLQCDGDVCGLYACHALPTGRVVRTFSNAPVFVAPGGTAQRNWGSAQRLPGDSLPVMRRSISASIAKRTEVPGTRNGWRFASGPWDAPPSPCTSSRPR
ncbi:DUF2380 domain-containing protein [Corallococcus sp. AB045]|uniref:DUF2380 domain-containing protein n=1 Tax=Corallococcus sp. AB045 TaxID=2316719 RepID=UPI00351475E5